jgi:glucosamine-6-phosphate deaminase
MRVIRCDDVSDLRELFGDFLIAASEANPRLTAAIPTGRTYEDLYQSLSGREGLTLANARCFALDELCVDGDGAPFRRFLTQNLIANTDLPESSLFTLPAAPEDPTAEAAAYESAITDAGGLDIAFLGIGVNGHIAFNEPGSPFTSCTRFVTLTDQTRQISAESFEVPYESILGAMTMGISTIVKAKKVLLIARGTDKARAVSKALNGPVTEDLPASILRVHPDVTVLVDADAGAKLK